MRIIETPEKQPERVLIYGAPKSAKTRLATSLPWGEFWGEKAVYVAADPGASTLRSVLKENRPHLLVVDPHPSSGPYDPLHEAVEVATHKWEGVGTIIWDTMTQTSKDLLVAYAKLCNYASNPITFGVPGQNEYHVHPNEGDYGAAQNSVINHITDHLFSQPLNLIIICHEQWAEPKNAAECVGGPELVGKAGVRKYPGLFDSVIRTETRTVLAPGADTTTEFFARMNPHGVWKCGIRNPGVSLPDVQLEENPIGFWHKYQEIL